MDKQKVWKVVLCACLGAVAVFLVAIYGLRDIGPAQAEKISYGAVASVGENCYKCHTSATPGIAEQYAHSKHVTRGVKCMDCHNPNIKGAVTSDHEGTKIVAKPTPANCAKCHRTEHAQFTASNHGARSWYSVMGAKAFTQEQLATYKLLDEKGKPKNDGKPNAVAVLEGEKAMELGCIKCHEIGKINQDGSIGDCSKCHIGHEYSLAQVRKPDVCGQCHLGPDHPQKEIYEESPHGVMFKDSGEKWNWNAAPGTLTAKDMPAPTCATCHMSGFGGAPGTHDVGARLAWNLSPEQATKREDWQAKRANMVSVCTNCHSQQSIDKNFKASEDLIQMTNQKVKEGKDLVAVLKKEGLITVRPFDSSIDYKLFELWHHEGRRARFGGMMGGPDYVQWHGIYEQNKDLVELKEMAADLREKAATNKTKQDVK